MKKNNRVEKKKCLDKKIIIYENKTREVIKLISENKYDEVSKVVTKDYDKLTEEISLLFLNFYSEEEICFYGIPLKITSKLLVSSRSKDFSSKMNDHWIICHGGSIFVAWKQDAAYFEVHYNDNGQTRTDKDGFTPTLERVLELYNKIYLIPDMRKTGKIPKFSDINFEFVSE